MAITYPLALPTTTDFRRVTMSGESVVGLSRSAFTKTAQAQEHQGMLWHIGITLRPMKRATAEAWIAFLLKLNGRQGTFLMYDPAGPTARGSLLGAPLVDGASQTGQELDTKGWDTNEVGVLLVGDYFSLGTDEQTRLYKVLDDVDSDGSGLATINIWPRLRESPGDSDALTFASAKGTFRLAGNVSTWDVSVAQFYGLGFSAEEAI